ncbi:DUF4254 domain-containing protein [Nocardia pseudobrasiliensis]|uniref:Uncharacterized protein DUF4254 n=1 Tax=Nocardia pseudobrasiliensis TaxID=45979 RepID=A0A370I2W1_9NOCA|nr:DUF4254 domain-containing protein [Nocardia pseudobrasiliensis]RDI65077.1 uncharacterized protein DUF4254 [Nocardia pseudobrasiliensis]
MNPLPTKTQLLNACRGVDYDHHPILNAAFGLTGIHERQLTTVRFGFDEMESRRAELLSEIDRCVARSLPPAHGAARIHTETMGAVVDRMARFTALAYAALAGTLDCELGSSWEHLAELAVAYEDLIDELHMGRRRLPGCA